MKKLLLILMLVAPMSMMAQKFGHINSQEVLASMPEFIKAKGEIDAMQKQYENDLKSMQDEFQRKADEYDKTKSTMNATKQQETEQNLQVMYQKIQQTFQDNQQALNKTMQDKMQPLQMKIMEAIKMVGKNGGYVYIMDVATGIPYISDTLSKDVTGDVKNQLNSMK